MLHNQGKNLNPVEKLRISVAKIYSVKFSTVFSFVFEVIELGCITLILKK